jgi:L-threonylcarbamoyladenylate synthase
LAGAITLPKAIEKIFSVKERPFFDPLIVHVHCLEQAKTLTIQWSEIADVLARKFWPGPLTLVLPKSSIVDPLITSGLQSVGIRMPNHPVAHDILVKLNFPLAAPSANKFGRVSPTTADHVLKEFACENLGVVEGGASSVGIESTVVSIQEIDGLWKVSVLRKGAILPSQISQALQTVNLKWTMAPVEDPKLAPGHMKHHYMPSIPFIVANHSWKAQSPESLLNAINSKIMEIPDVVESVRINKPNGKIKNFVELVLSEDSALAARQFYNQLRVLSEKKNQCIIFFDNPFIQGENWEALLERIGKAAMLRI